MCKYSVDKYTYINEYEFKHFKTIQYMSKRIIGCNIHFLICRMILQNVSYKIINQWILFVSDLICFDCVVALQ